MWISWTWNIVSYNCRICVIKGHSVLSHYKVHTVNFRTWFYFCDFMSVLQGLIPEVIPSQKCECRSNSQQLRSYRCLKLRKICILWKTSGSFMHLASSKLDVQFLFSVYFAFIPSIFHVTRGVRSGDCRGQFYRPSWPMCQSGNCPFTYSVTCWLKCGCLITEIHRLFTLALFWCGWTGMLCCCPMYTDIPRFLYKLLYFQ
jgi:hypothetical protein